MPLWDLQAVTPLAPCGKGPALPLRRGKSQGWKKQGNKLAPYPNLTSEGTEAERGAQLKRPGRLLLDSRSVFLSLMCIKAVNSGKGRGVQGPLAGAWGHI